MPQAARRTGCRNLQLAATSSHPFSPSNPIFTINSTCPTTQAPSYPYTMGLLSQSPPSPPSPPTPTASPDGAYIAPDRTARAHCWAARDQYFACLSRHDIVDSLKDSEKAEAACGNEDKEFGKECAKSWVSTSPAHSLKILFTVLGGLGGDMEEGERKGREADEKRRSRISNRGG